MSKIPTSNQAGGQRAGPSGSVFTGFPVQSHKKIKSRSVKPAMSAVN